MIASWQSFRDCEAKFNLTNQFLLPWKISQSMFNGAITIETTKKSAVVFMKARK